MCSSDLEWLEHFLQRFPGTVVAITHDRYFLDNAAEWILELARGQGIPWKGNYSDWLEQKEKRLEVEQKSEDARMKAMKEELKWVRSNAKRALLLVWRALALERTHLSSSFIAFMRASSLFCSTSSRFSFWSSQSE